jgi:hypothetical protein
MTISKVETFVDLTAKTYHSGVLSPEDLNKANAELQHVKEWCNE